MKKRKQKTDGRKTRYRRKNKHVDTELINCLFDCWKFANLGQCAVALKQLGMHQTLLGIDGQWCDIVDLECMYGSNCYAEGLDRITWYGGPELKEKGCKTTKFTKCQGTALDFVIDCVLFKVSREGPELLESVGVLMPC